MKRVDAAELVRRWALARREMSAALVACGIDPDDWGGLVDAERFTAENRRHLADILERVLPPVLIQARRVAR